MSAPRFATLSVAPPASAAYLFNIVGYAVVFLLVREIAWGARKDWPWLPFVPLIAIGVLEATLGQWQHVPGAVVQGTFGNHNHFAGLLEMILPGTVALGIALVKRDSFHPPSLYRTLSGGAFLIAAAALFVAILYSQSKMGFIATLFGLLAMGAMALWTGPYARRKWLGIAVLAAVLLCALVFLPSDQVVKGFGNILVDDSTGEGRVPVWGDTFRLIAAYPLFGSGMGTYASAFAKYQSSNVDVAFTYAHNDYLQLLAELGVAGFLLLGCGVVATISKVIEVTWVRDENIRYLGLACAGGMAAIGLHSFADFNLYIPGNAMILVWIAAIAAGLPSDSSSPTPNAARFALRLKPIGVALSGLLIAVAAGWLIFESQFRINAQAERQFCRFGICDIDSVLAAQGTAKTQGPVKNGSAAKISLLAEAVRRDPAAPGRWADLGDALFASGKAEQARRVFAQAVAEGPDVPPVLLRAAEFYNRDGEEGSAVELASHALARTTLFGVPALGLLTSMKLSPADILSRGLTQDPAMFHRYLRFLKDSGNAAGAAQAWDAGLASHYVDDPLAKEYVGWLWGRQEYQSAALAWAAYLGEHGQGYLSSNWIFNGGFESDPSPFVLDWNIGRTDGVSVERDHDVKLEGSYSLRIRLDGKLNLTDAGVSQQVVVTPGPYHFEAYVKTQDLTTDEGVRLRISAGDGTARLDARTEPLLGTHDWRKLGVNVCVSPKTHFLVVGTIRRPSLKFDNLIKGTLWLDSVSLSKLATSCPDGTSSFGPSILR